MKLFYWALLILFFSSAGPQDSSKSFKIDSSAAIHFLNRIASSANAAELTKVQKIGVAAYLQEQFNTSADPLPPPLQIALDRLNTTRLSTTELVNRWSKAMGSGDATQEDIRDIFQQSCQARLLRAIYSPRQLEEMMVDFWFNHFNVYFAKGVDRVLVGVYEREAIRPHVFGKFLDLLNATAKHPAMLFYLDNWQNKVAPQKKRKKVPQQGLNENYAREVMELHTLGVDGGYTQSDVIALAKILTGWGFSMKSEQKHLAGVFIFDPKAHDYSTKKFLGHIVTGTGFTEGEIALSILAFHPSTAKHISFKLAQYFVADDPPIELIEEMATKFKSSQGDIKKVLITLFNSPHFWDEKIYGKKFKTPYQYVVSVARGTNIKIENFKPLQNFLFENGMPLYGCLTPDGYKNTQVAWLSPDAILKRITFASAFSNGRLPLNGPLKSVKPPVPLISLQKLQSELAGFFSHHTLQIAEESPKNIQPALLLASPEFMRH